MRASSLLFLCSLAGILCLNDAALTTGCKDPSDIINHTVDLNPLEYDGIWYEQYRNHKSPFESKCFCNLANYTIESDGSVRVENTCRRGSATSPESNAVGTAVITDPKHPGFLLVSFWLPFIRSPYAVLDTDYHSYAIVASCPRFYGEGLVWILTREREVPQEELDSLLNKTSAMGFSRADLMQTYQGEECDVATGQYEYFPEMSGWAADI